MVYASNKILYQFLSFKNALFDLENDLIKVSKIDEINDPFEFLPYLGGKDQEGRKPFYKLKKRLSERFGILCFADNWKEPLLWGHYADKHKGVALGFKILKNELYEVEYIKNRPEVHLNISKRYDKSSFIELLKYKYEKWEYESEHRLLVNLSDCEEEKSKYFLPFKGNLVLKRIVLGCDCKCLKDSKEKKNITQLVKKYKAELIISRKAFRDYRIVRNKLQTAKILKVIMGKGTGVK